MRCRRGGAELAQLTSVYEIYPDRPGATMPLAVEVDGLVYAAGLVGVDPVSGEPVKGLIAQVSLALDHLRSAVEGAGGTLDNVGRIVAYVNSVEERNAVYQPWDALFPNPNDRPAFKVLVATLPPGELVRLDGIAIPGARRNRVDIESVPARDPTVQIGDWVFTSRVHGMHPKYGIPDDPAAEARQTFINLRTLLELTGAKPPDIAQMSLFCTDQKYFEVAEKAYSDSFGDVPGRPPLHRLLSYIAPQFRFSVEMIAVKGCKEPQHEFQEIYLAPEARCIPVGARRGALAIAPELTGSEPATGTVIAGDQGAQITVALNNMRSFLQAVGGNIDSLARVTFYMPDVDDRTTLNSVWAANFRDESTRPPHKYAPAQLSEGQRVRLHVLAVPDANRQTLKIPGLKHKDPMAMGAMTGNLVTSSRIFGTHAFSGEPAMDAVEGTALAFEHASTLLAQTGSDWQQLIQLTAFISEPGHRELVEAEWKIHMAANRQSPRLNIVEIQWAGIAAPRIEILALT